MRVIFLTPHLRISGGVKVICRFAHELARRGIETAVLPMKDKHKDLEWLTYDPKFRLLSPLDLDWEYVNSGTCCISYQDYTPDSGITIPEVMLLQGYVSKDPDAEIDPKDMWIVRDAPMPKAVIAVSAWLQKTIIDTHGLPTEVIPPGVDEIFVPKPKQYSPVPTIGGLYSRHTSKNFDMFIQTVEKLYYNYKLRVRPVVLSADPLAKIKVFDRLCLGYSLIARPPQQVLPHVYSSCDLWLSTSKLEGFGLTTLEAMACGVPTLWYPSMGLREYLQNGKHVIRVRNKNEAYKWVNKVLVSKTLRETLRSNGITLAKKFTWDYAAMRMITYLRKLFGDE